jgi:hypothetical protein
MVKNVEVKRGSKKLPMSVEQKIEQMKVLLSLKDDAEEDLLRVLLLQSERTILNYLNRYELPEELTGEQIRLAIVDYNRLGVEGQSAHSEGGVSRSYETGIPDAIKQAIMPFRLAKLASYT